MIYIYIYIYIDVYIYIYIYIYIPPLLGRVGVIGLGRGGYYAIV